MKAMYKILLVLLTASFLTGCGFQSIPESKNAVEASMAEMMSQYKRRADLIPNLVNAVKGYAKHESETLEGVMRARAAATEINIDASKATPEQMLKFQQAQGQLSQALGRLMVVSENYPNLKADQNFRDLHAQLEGTENRITHARRGYIESIQKYNNLISVPLTSITNMIFYHHEKMPQWDVAAEEKARIEQAPAVNF